MTSQEKIDQIMSILPPSVYSLREPNDITTPNYIQHIGIDVEKAQFEFTKLIDSILDTKFSQKENSRQGIIGRFLDDSGNRELYQNWYRFMCIDDNYKEWSQPYFAINKQTNGLCLNTTNPKLIAFYREKKLNEILMESQLQKSIRNLLSVYEDEKIVDKFAKERYYEKFPRGSNKHGWQSYNGYEILNDKLRINYRYGMGDMEFDSHFTVDLIPYYRDEKLKLIE